MFGRRLICSFCGKGEADVAKLVAGPKVFICDQCVAIASQIMEDSDNQPPSTAPRRGFLQMVLKRFRKGQSGVRRSALRPAME